jgi:hypothetical protein
VKAQKDLQPFERAMRLKLGLDTVPSKPVPKESKTTLTEKTPAEEWFAELHPGMSEEDLERLAQEF